jgi:hypothetical protein
MGTRRLAVVVATYSALSVALAAVTIALAAEQPAQDPAKCDITGLFLCESAGPPGTCVIRKTGETYQLLWKSGPRGRVAYGVGVRDGALLAASWKTRTQSGVVAYTISPGPKLAGKAAALPEGEGVYVETLTFHKPLAEVPAPREWQIGETALVNWSGDEYWYTATIAKKEGGRYFICFDDEGWFWVDPADIAEDDVKVGDKVFAKLTKRPDYRPGRVTGRKDRMIEVKFEDGTTATTTIHFIRVLLSKE